MSTWENGMRKQKEKEQRVKDAGGEGSREHDVRVEAVQRTGYYIEQSSAS